MIRASILCLALAVVSANLAQAATVEGIQRSIIAYRTKIQQGTLLITTNIDLNKHPLCDYSSEVITFDFTFRGQDMRLDRKQVAVVGGTPGVFAQRKIITTDECIYDEPGKSYLAVEVVKTVDMGGQILDDAFDPRMCGLVCSPITVWDNFGLEHATRLLIDRPATIRSERVDGEDLLVVNWAVDRKGEKREGTVWLCPRMGYGVLKAEASSSGFKAIMKADYHEVPGGLWYPREIAFEESRNGELTYREVSKIEADFSTPVDASQFTLAALNLPVGQRVRAFGQDKYWDGKALTP